MIIWPPWVKIPHTSDAADNPDIAPKRVQMAYAVEKNVISRYNGNISGEKIGNEFHVELLQTGGN